MYLELRSWKGSWLNGQPATRTRRFREQDQKLPVVRKEGTRSRPVEQFNREPLLLQAA